MANLTKKVLVAFCLFGFGIALKAQQTVAVAGQTTDTTKLAVTSLFGPLPDSQDKRESKAYSEWLFAHHDEGLMGIKNNRKTHEMIVKKFPGTDGARRAQRWLDDDKSAFQNLSAALLSTACKTVHWSIKAASASDEPIFSGSGSEDDFIPVATLSAITGLKTSSEIRVAALVLSAVYKRDEVGSMRVLAEYLQENQSR